MKLNKILNKVKKDKNGKYTTVEGESHGSGHSFMNTDVIESLEEVEMTDYTGNTYKTMLAVISGKVDFSHYNLNSKDLILTEEHNTLLLNPLVPGAVYEINRQIEVDSESAWNEELVRSVTD